MLRILLIAALAALPIHAATAAPLQPTGKWEVNYTATTCTAKRGFGDYTLFFEPAPLGQTTRYLIHGPGKVSRTRQYNSLIDLSDGGPPIRTTSLLIPLREKGKRAIYTVLPNSDALRIQKSGRLQIATAGTLVQTRTRIPFQPERMAVDLDLGPTASLSKALNTCMEDLHKFWGMVDGKVPEPATKAKGSLQGLFTSDDYPADAMASSDKGSTEYLLLLDETGSVMDCVVTITSKIASLDAMGCQVIRERAKFTPARNVDGKPVKDTYRTTVVWQILER